MNGDSFKGEIRVRVRVRKEKVGSKLLGTELWFEYLQRSRGHLPGF